MLMMTAGAFLVPAVATPAVASAQDVCLPASQLCLDNPGPNGNGQVEDQLQVDNGVAYNIIEIGVVSGPNQEPFTPGSGWNARYNGSQYVLLGPSGTNKCIVGQGLNGSLTPPIPVWTTSTQSYCDYFNLNASSPLAEWVVRGNWLVNVGDTDPHDSAGDPVILTAGQATHGAFVWTNLSGNSNNALDEWTGL
jgi:hypothetical protein